MKRRAFLRRLATAALGLTLARTLPGIVHAPPSLSPVEVASDSELGISIRLIKSFDITAGPVSRFDVFMAMPLDPEMTVRVAE